MLNHNPRRPGRLDSTALDTRAEPTFCGLEPLEQRIYADALPHPAISTATGVGTYATSSIFTTLGGEGHALPSTQWDNGHTLMGLAALRSDPRFAGYTGAGLRTVVLDTGINLGSPFFGPDNNNDGIADRIVFQYDFAMMDGDATDLIGHGSNVAAAIASSNPTYGGVAPGADIIALRVFNDAGGGSFAYLERALRWVINNAVSYNIVSVNMSLGDGLRHTSASGMYHVADEFATLAAMGVVVTAASGNGYYDGGSSPGVSYPAADPNVLAVGAVYGQGGSGFAYSGGARAFSSPAGALTPFTQRGSLLDILAPGAPIVGPSAGSGLSVMHGTSQAAPQIAGLAVLAQQIAMDLLGRRLSVNEFRTLLVGSAVTVIDGDDEDDNAINTGSSYPLVNALGLAEAIWSMRTVAAQSANTAPVLDTVEPLTGALMGRGAVVSHGLLARASSVIDAEGNVISFIVENMPTGTLTLNGRLVNGEVVVNPGDNLIWTPAPGSEGQLTAFRVRAFDGVLASEHVAEVRISVSSQAQAGSARSLRLVSDALAEEPMSGTSVTLASSQEPLLPTVRGLRFIDFTPEQPTERVAVATAETLFALLGTAA